MENDKFEIDAEVVINRLRGKLSDKDWEITLLETQIITLQNKIQGLEAGTNDSTDA